MKVTALVDRFGSNRMNAASPAQFLTGCSCVAVPFAGGMCEIPHFKANVLLVNDIDRHVINLCEVVRDFGMSLTGPKRDVAADGDKPATLPFRRKQA